ncbi:MAG: DUF11 domain-containing protein [Clostridiales bacterium]|nr:DUF11 domain-containing protein [Clostridiales bacterium]
MEQWFENEARGCSCVRSDDSCPGFEDCLCKVENEASVFGEDMEAHSNRVETRIKRPPCVEKFVDKNKARMGEELCYTVVIKNPCPDELRDLLFVDRIPKGTAFVPGSFCVNGKEVKPCIEDGKITHKICRLDGCEELVIHFKVRLVGKGHCCKPHAC